MWWWVFGQVCMKGPHIFFVYIEKTLQYHNFIDPYCHIVPFVVKIGPVPVIGGWNYVQFGCILIRFWRGGESGGVI